MSNQTPAQAELAMQAECFMWFHNSFPSRRKTLWHTNNKARNAIEGSKFKSMGVVSGVSDFVLMLPGEVVFIELKTETGTLSKDQCEFMKKCLEFGHEYFIVRSLEHFKSLVTLKFGTT